MNRLYPYQVEDVKELKTRNRIILGSVMRAGKMVETLELVRQLDIESILVVCPKSVIEEWRYNILDWLGRDWEERFDIINYEKLRRIELVAVIQKARYQLIVLDEAHKVKNRKAKQTKGAYLISSFSPRLIIATGTPMENTPADLWSLLHLIDPTNFNSYWKFAERYCYIEQLPIPPYPRIVVGAKNTTELRTLLSGYMLRREKEELLDHKGQLVVRDRAPLRTIPVELTDSQLEKYFSMEDELFVMLDNGEKITAPAVIAQLTRLRQICLEPNLLSAQPKDRVSTPSAKTELLLELIEDADSPVVVYTYFEKYTQILSTVLGRRSITHAVFSGAISDIKVRRQILEDFQANKYRVLVGTIRSLGLGITLTKSHIVVFTDLFWNPQVNDQAISRLEGTGQVRPVEVIDLWAKGTIEDHMHHVLKRKTKHFQDIVVKDVSSNQIVAETIQSMRDARQARIGGKT